MKRVLVLGVAGFIGRALSLRLVGEGAEVWGVDITAPPGKSSSGGAFDFLDLRYTPPRQDDFDEVYQLAADVGGVGYLSGGHDADVVANNVAINRNVAQWSVGRCGVLVFASSACVYPAFGNCMEILAPNPPWDEGDVTGGIDPANDYGAEKLFSERMYLAHARDCGLNVRIARLGNVYGPGEPISGPRAHLVGDLCRKALTEPSLKVWGDGRQIRSMVYIEDVVSGLIALARSDVKEPVNLAGRAATVAEIADTIGEFSGRAVYFGDPGPTGAHSSALNVDKAYRELGWRATTSLHDGLKATFGWAATQIEKRAA